MLDNEPSGGERTGSEPAEQTVDSTATTRRTRTTRRRTTAAEGDAAPAAQETGAAEPTEAPAKSTRRRRKATTPDISGEEGVSPPSAIEGDAAEAPAKTTRSRRKKAAEPAPAPAGESLGAATGGTEPEAAVDEAPPRTRRRAAAMSAPTVLFMAPEPTDEEAAEPARRRRRSAARADAVEEAEPAAEETEAGETGETGKRRRRVRRTQETAETAAEPAADSAAAAAEEAGDEDEGDEDELDAAGRRRRRRGRRGRGRGKGSAEDFEDAEEAAEAEGDEGDEDSDEPLTRRRRRRRRKGAGDEAGGTDDGVPTVVRIREPRRASDEVQGVTGSTRLEAKRQRRRDGRDQRRTRPPILSESEFLARREAVDRVMVIRQRGERTQIAVLEDGVLVEHYVTRASAGTMAGNVYLGKVQNVLPSMEAAFVDVGRGRNAVLYAGEVNWDATGLEGRARSIEQALKSGDSVLVQVTKDPIGHKGARLTSHVALSGRHLVYVPNGNASGISRKLPDNERKRLRDILKKLVPDGAGVIVRTAAEGASEDELARDVKRLQAQWEDIQAKAAEGSAPVLLYEEPDLVIRVVRDLFNEDFRELVVQGEEAYAEVEAYLSHVSPDLVTRLRRHAAAVDVFAEKRIDEQILKGLDRKVFLPSGGHLVIDRTEAMTVVDVNTGKYTGAGGNLEETVTRNNLEAAEEIVRQLRLRDLGGIVVIDFIDMVLESNRELVLRRLTECLGRDRTKHQVTEITSLGLVQMTRKRIGAGLLEAFSETCEHCKGRGLIIHTEPVAEKPKPGAGDKVKAVASAAGTKAESGGRRRGRKAAEAASAAAAPASEMSGVAGSAPVPAADSEDDETMGYDLSRYELPEVERSTVDVGTEALVPDAADLDPDLDPDLDAGLAAHARLGALAGEDEVADFDDEDEDAGLSGTVSSGRRRARRGGARRRTRP
jgi:ribonuclease E